MYSRTSIYCSPYSDEEGFEHLNGWLDDVLRWGFGLEDVYGNEANCKYVSFYMLRKR
jgi:hypothetical protein